MYTLKQQLQQLAYKFLDPFVKLLIKIGVTPNMVTKFGFILTFASTVVLIYGAETGDRDNLGAILHKIEGVTCYAGLPRLKKILARYEEIKKETPEQVFKIVENVIEELLRIKANLYKYIL